MSGFSLDVAEILVRLLLRSLFCPSPSLCHKYRTSVTHQTADGFRNLGEAMSAVFSGVVII